jgi:DNA-binding NarL/FixJ family response regulator
MRAVIADPDLSERATLVDLCYSHGGLDNLIVVESGTEALKQIRVNRPDVVLLTCELEEMTGFDVTPGGNYDRSRQSVCSGGALFRGDRVSYQADLGRSPCVGS